MKTKKKAAAPAVDTLTPILRVKIREVLSALPVVPAGKKIRALPVGMIVDGLRAIGYEVTSEQVDIAIEWNHERNLIDYRHNHDFNRDEWFLTEKGRRHE